MFVNIAIMMLLTGQCAGGAPLPSKTKPNPNPSDLNVVGRRLSSLTTSHSFLYVYINNAWDTKKIARGLLPQTEAYQY